MINLAFSLIRKIYHSLHSSHSCQCSIEVCQVEIATEVSYNGFMLQQ